MDGTTPAGVRLSDHRGLVVEVAGPNDPWEPTEEDTRSVSSSSIRRNRFRRGGLPSP